MINAQTSLLSAKLQLNTYLANTLDDEFDIEDVGLDSKVYRAFKENPLSEFVNSPKSLDIATEFLVEEATANNPSKQQILQNIKAAEREKIKNRRLYFTPTVSLQGNATRVLSMSEMDQSQSIPGFEIQRNQWNVGFGVSYPIFQSNKRHVDLQRSRIQIAQLNNATLSLDQNLELSVRTSALSLLNAYTNINFSRTAAENAKLNFELVQDNYQQGTISITQLIDAQNATLRAQLGYSVSIYDYMVAQLQVEYSIGFFSMLETEEANNDLMRRFLEFISEQ